MSLNEILLIKYQNNFWTQSGVSQNFSDMKGAYSSTDPTSGHKYIEGYYSLDMQLLTDGFNDKDGLVIVNCQINIMHFYRFQISIVYSIYLILFTAVSLSQIFWTATRSASFVQMG